MEGDWNRSTREVVGQCESRSQGEGIVAGGSMTELHGGECHLTSIPHKSVVNVKKKNNYKYTR